MPTVTSDLTRIRRILNDAGTLWTDAELLRLYNDAYRELLAESEATRRWRAIDVPGRHTYSLTYEWEDASVTGTVRKWTRTLGAGDYQGSVLWEAEHVQGMPPSTSLAGITQEWERAFVATDRHYRFSFEADHQRPVRLYWDGKRLDPISVRELDQLETAWEQDGSEPRFWTPGLGRLRSVELYQIETTYSQQYRLIEPDDGIARGISGDRTYGIAIAPDLPPNRFAYTNPGEAQAVTMSGAQWIEGAGARITTDTTTSPVYSCTQLWEVDMLDGAATLRAGAAIGCFVWERFHGAQEMILALGLIRRITSPDRQYLAQGADLEGANLLMGRVVDWRSSEDSVLALEVVVPTHDLTAADVPALIPAPLQKYLRFYVLGMALGRPGEGRNPILASHYLSRFRRGVQLLKRLGAPTFADMVYRRESWEPPVIRPPRVQLPAEFPRVL